MNSDAFSESQLDCLLKDIGCLTYQPATMGDEAVCEAREWDLSPPPLAVGKESNEKEVSYLWGEEIRKETSCDEGSEGLTESSGQSSPVARPKGAPAVEATKFRTKVCRNWAAGIHCQFGDRCAFAHGSHQVRTSAQHNPFFDVYSQQGARTAPKQAPPTTIHRPATTTPTPPPPAALPWSDALSHENHPNPVPVEVADPFVDTSGCVWFN